MQIKKKFKLVQDYLEEDFLNKQSEQGYELQSYDGVHYTFTNSNEKVYYLVEFYFNKLSTYEIKMYAKKGYSLIIEYEAVDQGYFYFFKSSNPVNDLDRNLKDRHALLVKSKQRVDRFSSIIFVAAFSLFTYWYFTTDNQLYIFLLLLTVLMGGYFGHIYLTTIKRLSDYVKIIERVEGE